MSDARFIWTAWISNIILLKKKNIQLYMCFENDEQLHINNCLTNKLINMVIKVVTYVKNNLTNINKISDKQHNFVTNKLYF